MAIDRRSGVSSIEFLVSFSVMATVMTCATTMTLNINRVWRDIEHHRLAVCELSNQLEELTLLTGDNLTERITEIRPSDFCKQGLNEPRISAEISSDNLGQRIDLELVWKHQPVERKVRLSGWAIQQHGSMVEKTGQGEQP